MQGTHTIRPRVGLSWQSRSWVDSGVGRMIFQAVGPSQLRAWLRLSVREPRTWTLDERKYRCIPLWFLPHPPFPFIYLNHFSILGYSNVRNQLIIPGFRFVN